MTGVRLDVRDPLVVLVVTAGLACGGVATTYPTAFLGEHHAPGLLAGLLLGSVGALALTPVWAFAVAVAVAAGPTTRALRMVRHAQGRSQTRQIGDELLRCAELVAVGAVAGALGGVLSAAGQAVSVRPAPSAWSLAPSPSAVVAAMGVALVALVLGCLLGNAASDPSAALVTISAVLMVSAVLVGGAYFSPGVGVVASATPLGGLLTLAKDNLLAPQFTRELSLVPALIGVLLWIVTLLFVAARRLRRQVG